jgi:ketosteroid isomerase-like protein
MNIKQILMAVLLIALSLVAVAAECTEAQTKAFEKWDRDWSKYSDEGNRAELEKIYADDYVGIGYVSLNPDNKKKIIDDDVKDVGSNPNVKASTHSFLITCTPNTVTITHRITRGTTTNGEENTSWGRTTHVLEKRNGNWQAVTSIGPPVTADGEVLFSLLLDGSQALMDRDLDWFKKNYDDSFIGATNDGRPFNKSSMIANMEKSWKDDKTKYEFIKFSRIAPRVDGNMGVIGNLRHSKGVGNDGKPFDKKELFMTTFVKKDGKWMMVAESSTDYKERDAADSN